jgi:hypothetical protein
LPKLNRLANDADAAWMAGPSPAMTLGFAYFWNYLDQPMIYS